MHLISVCYQKYQGLVFRYYQIEVQRGGEITKFVHIFLYI